MQKFGWIIFWGVCLWQLLAAKKHKGLSWQTLTFSMHSTCNCYPPLPLIKMENTLVSLQDSGQFYGTVAQHIMPNATFCVFLEHSEWHLSGGHWHTCTTHTTFAKHLETCTVFLQTSQVTLICEGLQFVGMWLNGSWVAHGQSTMF